MSIVTVRQIGQRPANRPLQAFFSPPGAAVVIYGGRGPSAEATIEEPSAFRDAPIVGWVEIPVAGPDGAIAGVLHCSVGVGCQDVRYMEIAVSDTGSGMPQDVLARMFEPYFTTKDPGRGTGLGLDQVRRFVERSGGALRVDSVPEVGSTVRMRFPCAGT
jgi:signal transduction histidine kinase